MKCIVIETSPERTSAHTVTNEDGTPHVYATISEARAELKANGYSYNRANARYYLAAAPEYRAYIIREDSEEYAVSERIMAAHQAEQAAAEAERAKAATIAARDARDVTAAATHSHEAATAAQAASKAALEAYHMSGNSTDTHEYIAAAEAASRANEAASIAIRAFYETAEQSAAEAEQEPAPVYQRHELEAYLGEPEDYDVDAIEAEATAYDPATGRRIWVAFGDDLAAIAERHQTATYYAI